MSTPISPDDNVEYVNPNPIQPGEVMPTDILCESYQGQPVSIEDLVKTNGLVLFTVPMAGTCQIPSIFKLLCANTAFTLRGVH